jgi:hypothetical protein
VPPFSLTPGSLVFSHKKSVGKIPRASICMGAFWPSPCQMEPWCHPFPYGCSLFPFLDFPHPRDVYASCLQVSQKM